MSTFSLVGVLIAICLSQSDDSIVEIEGGLIQGNVSSRGRAFTSVPYAAPPIGALRWQPPQSHQAWSNTLETMSDPPGCLQEPNKIPYVNASKYQEDCLYLNIFTPPITACNANNTSCPVMVFFYGGGYMSGYCGGWLYNGTNLASLTNSIVVSVNYRLGMLGFLYDHQNGVNGNMGYFDGIFAVQWTKSNIAAFGGDPNKITIFGQSAGARNVGTMLADLTINGLFQNAIMESHGMNVDMLTGNDWTKLRKDFYGALQCEKYKNINECLLNVTSDEILAAQQKVPRRQDFGPTLNISDNIKIASLYAVQQNIYNSDVNVIIGMTKQEWWLFSPVPLDEIAYNASVLELANYNIVDYEKIYKEYPCSHCTDIDYQNNEALMRTDYGFICPALNGTISIANNKGGHGGIYSYHFDHASTFNNVMLPLALEHQCYGRACHTSELPYVFQPDFEYFQYFTDFKHANYSQNETLLADIIQFYWATFALTGKPGNGQNKFTNVEWIEFDAESQQSMVFEAGSIGMKHHYYDACHCSFWDSLRK